jgi:hypothetical protein
MHEGDILKASSKLEIWIPYAKKGCYLSATKIKDQVPRVIFKVIRKRSFTQPWLSYYACVD